MIGFTTATLLPLPLLLLGATLGGVWSWAALGYLTVFTAFLDLAIPQKWRNASSRADFPAAEGLSDVLGILHFWLMIAAIRWIGGPSGAEGMSALIAGLAFAVYFGQISHPNAHELIHRPQRRAVRLGRMVYASLLFGHHASAHRKVHHVHVATERDPNTARLGESFYRYAVRAWFGSFWAGLRAERADLRRAGKSRLATPYVTYVVGAVAVLALAWALSGPRGVAAVVAICWLAQMQILMSDYIQHYGLLRHEDYDGQTEPFGPQHAWNSPHSASGAMMLNAPRHSDHHLHPGRAFPALQLNDVTMPMLPYALPVMAVIALFPGLWRRVMDSRVQTWSSEAIFLGDPVFGRVSAI